MAPPATQTKQIAARTTVPLGFVATCLLLCSGIAFTVGRVTRFCLVPDLDAALVQGPPPVVAARGKDGGLLPTPKAHAGKIIPQTIYTTKNFDTRLSALSASQWLQPADEEASTTPNASPTNNVVVPDPANEKLSLGEDGTADYDKDEEEHLPAGQHLLVDIDGLEAAFLDSEARLATAMIAMVDNSGLTLLSYHCHGMYPEGVSCAGVLLESHVSFHTWPTEGVITLDLFTCGATSLLDSMPLIEDLFVVPRDPDRKPNVMWAYKRRGFNEQSGKVGERDTFAYPLGVHGMEYKKELASLTTSSGKIARVYEMQEHRHPSPTRQVYLDGVLKSNSVGQAAAHESSVHPPMLAHSAPKRVVIFGAGLGASTREVLKHAGVEEVTVVGADRAMVGFSKEYLPEWSDCSYASKNGEPACCFDDDRVNFVYDQTPLEWIASYGGPAYDVALVDLFDMEEEFAIEIMSNREHTLDQLLNRLSHDGVVSVNIAGSTKAVESMTKSGMTPTRKILQTTLAEEMKKTGFVEAYEYNEYKSGFSETRSYVVAFKDAATAKNWNTKQSETEIKLNNRIARDQSTGELALEFFDAATMATYSKFSTKSSGGGPGEDRSGDVEEEEAVEEAELSEMAGGMAQTANSSCSSTEDEGECKNPSIDIPEEQMRPHEVVRES
ncbi:unnamed protein product [Pseudo-nitzschia multistriata]|uniref:PABS domain-containing protein n=1 Tax=Pseudo-nitzschia multistriata TaxID=183589 RepID=A0A448YUA7_9STRA|nr:unnamed protein product [Pseudo-nitzschia multistriata]